MLDIETAHKLASFLEAKLSLKNTTEIPRPVHGPLQFQQVASARHPTKANTAKALVEPGDFPALWLDGFSLKPANHHSTPNLGHRALLISCGLHGHRHKKKSQSTLENRRDRPTRFLRPKTASNLRPVLASNIEKWKRRRQILKPELASKIC